MTDTVRYVVHSRIQHGFCFESLNFIVNEMPAQGSSARLLKNLQQCGTKGMIPSVAKINEKNKIEMKNENGK